MDTLPVEVRKSADSLLWLEGSSLGHNRPCVRDSIGVAERGMYPKGQLGNL